MLSRQFPVSVCVDWWTKTGASKFRVPLFRCLRAILLIAGLTAGLTRTAEAQLGARSAQEWIKVLESSNRIEQLKLDETIQQLKLRPGAVVADIGAGSGLFTIPLARAVSPGGMVYAVDIQQDLLDHVAERAKELQVTNIQPVLGKFTDPNLPADTLDLAFIYDVLHHIEDRATYLKHLAKCIKPAGRIAVVDFQPDKGPHKDDPTLQVTREQAAAWMAAAGFRPTEEFHLFPDKWFVVYSRQR